MSLEAPNERETKRAHVSSQDSGITAGGSVVQQGYNVAGRDLLQLNIEVHESAVFARVPYRKAIQGLLNFHNRTFVGRANELETLVRWIGEPVGGYRLVEASPGMGKTALLAQVVSMGDHDEWPSELVPDVVCFFIREEGARNTPQEFLLALNSQLLDLLGLPGAVPDELTKQRAQLVELWSAAVGRACAERPLLLVVDGLDEQAVGVPCIADLLPDVTGPFVHVLVASRTSPPPRSQVGWEHILQEAATTRLGALDLHDIVELLEVHHVSVKLATATAARIIEITRGEPLFARFVCEDLARDGEAALAALERDPPVRVQDYFARQLAQLQARATGQLDRDALGVLLAAAGPMTPAELAGVLGVREWQLERALQPIRRFLLDGQQLELMHQEFHRTATAWYDNIELDAYRERLVTWCRGFAAAAWPANTPDYVLEHIAKHLRAAEDHPDLFHLLTRRWMHLKLSRTRSHWSFVQDVLLAIEVASSEQPPNLVEQLRASLVYVTLRSMAAEVPPEVIAALAATGDLQRAHAHTALIRSGASALALERLLVALVDAGEADQALSIAQAINNAAQRAEMFTEVASALIDAGGVSGAV
jgi:hypothetical protein